MRRHDERWGVEDGEVALDPRHRWRRGADDRLGCREPPCRSEAQQPYEDPEHPHQRRRERHARLLETLLEELVRGDEGAQAQAELRPALQRAASAASPTALAGRCAGAGGEEPPQSGAAALRRSQQRLRFDEWRCG